MTALALNTLSDLLNHLTRLMNVKREQGVSHLAETPCFVLELSSESEEDRWLLWPKDDLCFHEGIVRKVQTAERLDAKATLVIAKVIGEVVGRTDSRVTLHEGLNAK